MISRHLKLLVLLLPLLIARSVLPIGFMLSFDGGVPRIVFCPGQIAAPSEAMHHGPHQAHLVGEGQKHHHGVDQSAVSSSEHSHQICPFALAAAAPLAFPSVFVPEAPACEATLDPPGSAILVVALYAHPIRGPPALS